MSPYILKLLFGHVKQVIAKPFAITDQYGTVYKDCSDFNEKQFVFLDQATPDQQPLRIKGQENLRGIAIYANNKLGCILVTEIDKDDLRLPKIITSLAHLIIQQFLNANKPRPNTMDLLLTRVTYRPQTIDAEEFEQQIAAFGFRLDTQRTALAIELHGFWQNYLQTIGQPLGEKEDLIAAKKRDLEKNLTSFFTRNRDNIIGFVGNDLFVVLKDLHNSDYEKFCTLLTNNFRQITDSLKNVHITDITIGIGSSADSSSELLRSVGESFQVLNLGKRLKGANRVYRFSDLGFLPMIISSSNQQKKSRAAEIIKAVNDRELIETLDVFLASNLNLTQAAQKLKIHRNTVIYRLDKILEKIGKDPRKFEDAVELHLARFLDKALD